MRPCILKPPPGPFFERAAALRGTRGLERFLSLKSLSESLSKSLSESLSESSQQIPLSRPAIEGFFSLYQG